MIASKLSCSRCRGKKLRCDKREPQCSRCKTSGTECHYPTRRFRRRRLPEKTLGASFDRIARRIEFLEKHIVHPTDTLPSGRENSDSKTPSPSEDESIKSRWREESTDLLDAMEKPSWIDYMITKTKDAATDALKRTSYAAGTSHLDPGAIETLNSAIEDLKNFKLKKGITTPDSNDNAIPRELAEKWIEATTTTFAFDSFIGLVDKNLMKIVPQMIGSPYIKLELSLVLVYYAFLYAGCALSCSSETTKFLPTIYLKCLEVVPQWQMQAKGDIMDLVAASLMTWVAVQHFDYHLSWKFHCEACRFAHILGFTQIDGPSSQDVSQQPDHPNDLDIEIKRKGFWQLMRTEMLFRLYYNKPPVLTAISWRVRFPSMITTVSAGYPDATSLVVFIVSSRITLLKMEFFDQLQAYLKNGEHEVGAFHRKIDEICHEIEDLMNGWKMMHWIERTDNWVSKSMFASLIINAYTSIIIMTRKKLHEDEFAVSERVVHAARMVLKAISLSNVSPQASMTGLLNFISFYPFVAVFSLYYHIAVVVDPEECEEDIRDLERLSQVVKLAAVDRGELTPVTKALMALNGLCRTLQDRKRCGSYHLPSLTHQLSKLSDTSARMPYPPVPLTQEHVGRIPGMGLSTVSLVPFPTDTLWANGNSAKSVSQGISAGNPLEYMMELESDFVGRNWHENWWCSNTVTGENAGAQPEPEP